MVKLHDRNRFLDIPTEIQGPSELNIHASKLTISKMKDTPIKWKNIQANGIYDISVTCSEMGR